MSHAPTYVHSWRKQGAAIVGNLTLLRGRVCNVVLVGNAQNAKGATLVLPGEGGRGPKTVLLSAGHDLLHPRCVIDILCMQERFFGNRGLPVPGLTA